MYYDPIKNRLGRTFSLHPVLQKTFYRLLNLFFLRAWYVRRELRRLVGLMPQNRPVNILDAGTGFGQYAYFLARQFPHVRVLAVDVKDDYLEIARQFIQRTPEADRVRFEKADLTVLDIDERFDLILSVDVMEHIADDRGVFRNFERVLNPGGYVVINTPSDLGGSDISDEDEDSFIGEHVRPGYNRDELAAKLLDAGLVVTKSVYTYGRHGSRAWRLLIKWPMKLLERNRAAFAVLPIYYLAALPVGTALNALDVRGENESGTGLLVVAQKPA